MNPPYTAVLIPAAAYRPMEIIAINDLDEGLDFLVGGECDVIHPNYLNQTWWVNQDRTVLGLARNDRATDLAYRHGVITETYYYEGKHIAGDMVITGGTDRTGEPLGLPEDQAVRLIRTIPDLHGATRI